MTAAKERIYIKVCMVYYHPDFDPWARDLDLIVLELCDKITFSEVFFTKIYVSIRLEQLNNSGICFFLEIFFPQTYYETLCILLLNTYENFRL